MDTPTGPMTPEERAAADALRQRVRDRMEAEGIPIGTDDPLLLALGARPLPVEHECRFPRPNTAGFPVNQCLDCGEWIIAAPDLTPPPTAAGS